MVDDRVTERTDKLVARLRALGESGGSPQADEARERLREEIVALHLPMAKRVAGRYRGRGVPDEDLVQVAALGLVKAVNGYEPGRGDGFSVYAVPTIRGEVRRYFRDHGWDVRPPRRVQELAGPLSETVQSLEQQLGRSPTYREISTAMQVDEDEVIEVLVARQGYGSASLDAPRGVDDGSSWADHLPDDGDEMEGVAARVALRELLRELPARDRQLLALRFFADKTQAQIGADIGVTQMQVSRLLSRSLAQLRQRLEDEPPASPTTAPGG